MKLRFKEAYQGWAAVELGGQRHERVEPGVHEVTQEFADYLLAKFPHLVEVVKEQAEEEKPKRGRLRKEAGE